MSWLNSVRNALSFVVPKKETSPTTCGTSARAAGRWSSPRSWRRTSGSARIATTMSGSARRSALRCCSNDTKYEVIESPRVAEDPLKFRDTKRYSDRLKAARAATGEGDALVNARGRIGGHKVGRRRAGLRLHGWIDGPGGR